MRDNREEAARQAMGHGAPSDDARCINRGPWMVMSIACVMLVGIVMAGALA